MDRLSILLLKVLTVGCGLKETRALKPFPHAGDFRSRAFPPRRGLAGQREPQGARQTAPLGGAAPHDQTS